MKEKIRGFEVCKGWEDKGINIPKPSTTHSAGNDFEAAEDTIIPVSNKKLVTFVPTGIKAYMQEGEVLQLYDRSSNPHKKGICLANSVGIIDKDYYSNPDNDGHIMFTLMNLTDEDIVIKKGERLGQGVFINYLRSDDSDVDTTRESGFGSTGK